MTKRQEENQGLLIKLAYSRAANVAERDDPSVPRPLRQMAMTLAAIQTSVLRANGWAL